VTAHESFGAHNSIHVLFGDGHGHFQREAVVPLFDENDNRVQASSGGTRGPAYSVVATDLNGDGLPDIAVANSYFPRNSIFMNRGKGRFAPVWTTHVATPRAVSLLWHSMATGGRISQLSKTTVTPSRFSSASASARDRAHSILSRPR